MITLYDLAHMITHWDEVKQTRINKSTNGISATKLKSLVNCKELGLIEFVENFGEQSRLTDKGVNSLQYCLDATNGFIQS